MKTKLTMSERLRVFITNTGLQNNEFARKIGATNQQVSDWLGGRPLPLNRIYSMEDQFPDLNVNWLLFGKGNMLLTDNSVSEPAIEYCSNPQCRNEIERLTQELEEKNNMIIQLQNDQIELLKDGIKKNK